ncbi:hypothetical protein KP509_25G013400 [Ceratopteris richardii]|uniref:Cytochrome P450 n=1 Tax=Ceratopteris richardii TaxID=49495 RepID=A0A8T2RMS2_CERRI|nr:hypothetical protein KP509_25G013400 [Ceratopteris richardii]
MEPLQIDSSNASAATELSDTWRSEYFSTSSVVLCLLMVYLFIHRWSQRKLLAPKSWPLLGASIEQFMNYDRLHDWLLEYLEKTDTIRVPMPFGHSYTYTTNPDNVEYILKSNFSNFPKGHIFHENMEELLGDGIFNSDGDAWRQQRKTASFEFASKVLRDFSTVVFREYAHKLAFILVHLSQVQGPVDMQDIFMRLTLDSICKIGFGVDMGTLSPVLPEVPFAKCFDQANYIVTLRFIDPLWKIKRIFNLGQEALLKKSINVIDDFTYGVIRTRREEMNTQESAKSKDAVRPDILSRFIMLSNDPESNLNDKSLRDIVLNFVIAGRDTTAVTLSWFTFLLAKNTHVADRIYEELCAFEQERKQASSCADKSNQHPSSASAPSNGSLRSSSSDLADTCSSHPDLATIQACISAFSALLSYDSISCLPYLHASICETLRLYPAVPEDPKGILSDDVLPSGVALKKGCMITYSPYCMGRMKALWGDDSKSFNPDRWIKDNSVQSVSPFKFATFQAGPRICIGKDSAFLQMKITTAILCRFFTFTLVEEAPIKYKTMAILAMAHGLKVLVTPRL